MGIECFNKPDKCNLNRKLFIIYTSAENFPALGILFYIHFMWRTIIKLKSMPQDILHSWKSDPFQKYLKFILSYEWKKRNFYNFQFSDIIIRNHHGNCFIFFTEFLLHFPILYQMDMDNIANYTIIYMPFIWTNFQLCGLFRSCKIYSNQYL